MRAYVVAALATSPLLVPEVWGGFRLGLSDVARGVIAATEQPLSARSPGGVWAMALALAWFALAYWHRRVTLWEAGLVLIGGAAALARLGNAWLYAIALVVPLGTIYLIGVGLVAVLLLYEQSLVSSTDLSQVKRAFDLNGYVGILYFLTTAVAVFT